MAQTQSFTQALARFQEGRFAEAERLFRDALELFPEDVNALNLLGVACGAQDRHEDALDPLRKALRLHPQGASIHFNLGRALEGCGRLDEAVAAFAQALALNPGMAEARERLGALGAGDALAATVFGDLDQGRQLLNADRPAEALEWFQKAVREQPASAGAWEEYGRTLGRLGRNQDQVQALRRSLALQPDQPKIHQGLLMNLLYLDGSTPEGLLEEHRSWCRRHAGPRVEWAGDAGGGWEPGRRLKVGYVSPDFRGHSVATFLEPLLARHDRSQFELHAYSEVLTPDPVTQRLRDQFTGWHPTKDLDDEALAARIREDGIDILVDLAGHTHGNRISAFQRRPAPVQVTWLGYPATTGMPCFDARLTDAFVDPPDTDANSSEPLVRLGTGWLCFSPPAEAPPPATLPALANGFVSFGSFNNAAKLSPGTLSLWAAVLRRVAGSRLLLKSSIRSQGHSEAFIQEAFADEGVAPSRVQFLPYQESSEAHLAAYSQVDLALDPLPFNAITTACEGLWMGVPTVTLPGNRMSARAGAGIMLRAGLPRFIAQDRAGFVNLAAAWAADLTALAELRQGLREQVRASELMDGAGFTREVETAYRALWSSKCAEARA